MTNSHARQPRTKRSLQPGSLLLVALGLLCLLPMPAQAYMIGVEELGGQEEWLSVEEEWSGSHLTIRVYQAQSQIIGYYYSDGWDMYGSPAPVGWLPISGTFFTGFTLFCDATWNPDALTLLTDPFFTTPSNAYEYEFDPDAGLYHLIDDAHPPGLVAEFPFRIESHGQPLNLQIDVLNTFDIEYPHGRFPRVEGRSGAIHYEKIETPEPATLTLLVLGGAGAAVVRKRSRGSSLRA